MLIIARTHYEEEIKQNPALPEDDRREQDIKVDESFRFTPRNTDDRPLRPHEKMPFSISEYEDEEINKRRTVEDLTAQEYTDCEADSDVEYGSPLVRNFSTDSSSSGINTDLDRCEEIASETNNSPSLTRSITLSKFEDSPKPPRVKSIERTPSIGTSIGKEFEKAISKKASKKTIPVKKEPTLRFLKKTTTITNNLSARTLRPTESQRDLKGSILRQSNS